MDADINIDFTDKIKANEADKLTYRGPDGFPGEDKREFKYLKNFWTFRPPLILAKRPCWSLPKLKK